MNKLLNLLSHVYDIELHQFKHASHNSKPSTVYQKKQITSQENCIQLCNLNTKSYHSNNHTKRLICGHGNTKKKITLKDTKDPYFSLFPTYMIYHTFSILLLGYHHNHKIAFLTYLNLYYGPIKFLDMPNQGDTHLQKVKVIYYKILLFHPFSKFY